MFAYTKSIIVLFALFILSCSSPPGALQPLAANATILAFGDSLTHGYGPESSDSYPAILSVLIDRDVVNAGIPGELSADGLNRLPALLEQHSPDLVILCHGGNDILRKQSDSVASDNLAAMIDLIHQHGADVLLVAVPKPAIMLKNSPIYLELAEEKDIAININALKSTLGRPSLKKDAVHPNAAGNQSIAESIVESLEHYNAI